MSPILRVAPLLIATLLMSVATGLINTVVSLRISDEGYTSSIVGLVMSCYFAGQLLGCLMMPLLIAKIGHVKSYVCMAILLSVCAISFGLIFDLAFWALFRLIAGSCMVGLFMVTESWLNGTVSNQTRGLMLGIYMTIVYCSQAGGQLLLNLGPIDDFKLYAAAGVLYFLALVPVVFFRGSKPRTLSSRRFSLRRLIQVSPVGVIGCLASGLITGSFYGLGPVYALQSGLSTVDISIFMGLCIAGSLLIQLPVGRLSDLIGRRIMNVAILLCTALISALFLTSLADERIMLFILVTLYGGLSLSIYTLANAHANDLVSHDERVSVAANLLLTYAVGAVVGPLLSALLMDRIGHQGLFWFSTLVSLMMAVAVVYRVRFEGRHAQSACSPASLD